MTETPSPATRPGQKPNSRADCPDWCESNHDRNKLHIRQLSPTFPDDPVRATLIRSDSDRQDRIMVAASETGQGWRGAVTVEAYEADDLAGMLDTLGAHDAANDVRKVSALRQPKVDGPRASAPVEVLAERYDHPTHPHTHSSDWDADTCDICFPEEDR